MKDQPETFNPNVPLSSLTVVPFKEAYVERVRHVLEQHGCTLVIQHGSCLVTFPQGTTRKEVLPRLPSSAQFTICLPDGYTMIERVSYMRGAFKSTLVFAREDIEPDDL